MAGRVQNRSIPTLLEIQIAATMRGQVFECSCGERGRGDYVDGPGSIVPECPMCESRMFPVYNVHNSRGHVVGEVCGLSHNSAIETVRQTPEFDRLKSFTVSPKVWGQS